MENRTLILGVYRAAQDIAAGAAALHEAGFRNEDISLLYPEVSTSGLEGKESEGEAGAPRAAGPETHIGVTLGDQAGMCIVTVPDTGALIAAGTLMAGLCTGLAQRGVSGALIAIGVPEYEATCYESRVKEGAILLFVQTATPGLIEQGQAALKGSGAQDVSFTLDAGSKVAKGSEPDSGALAADITT